MGAVVKEIDSHGPAVAASEWWENGGRYDDRNTAWGWRLELHKDGTVYRQRLLFHRDQGAAVLRRQKAATLDRMRKDFAAWQDFRDAWIAMQRNLGHEAGTTTEMKARTACR